MYFVDAGPALDHEVAGRVDDVDVVAVAAAHGVGAGLAIEQVVAGVAGDLVGECAADAGAGAGQQHEVLDVRRQDVAGGRAVHAVVTAARGFDDDVAGIVDDIDVVAHAAGQLVDAALAVEHI